jgi:calcineurin-like phosphoesterase family protein
MPRPAKRFVITDTHLFNTELVTGRTRPGGKSVPGGVRPSGTEIEFAKSATFLVCPQDTTIFLGDVIDHADPCLEPQSSDLPLRAAVEKRRDLRAETLSRFLENFAGVKLLVRGNHDHKPDNWYVDCGFNAVVDRLQIGDAVFSHEPIRCLWSNAKFNVHGHLHRGDDPPDWYCSRVHRLVSHELLGYRVVDLDDVLAADYPQRLKTLREETRDGEPK